MDSKEKEDYFPVDMGDLNCRKSSQLTHKEMPKFVIVWPFVSHYIP